MLSLPVNVPLTILLSFYSSSLLLSLFFYNWHVKLCEHNIGLPTIETSTAEINASDALWRP